MRLLGQILFLFTLFLPRILLADEAKYFDQKREFPRYFLSEAYRDIPVDEIPLQVIQEDAELLEKAVHSLLSRVTFPVIQEGETEVSHVRFFEYVESQLKKVDPNVEFLASGGTVRSTISHLYSEIYIRKQRDPNFDEKKFMQEVIESNDDIPILRIKGMGSDWDTLVISPAKKEDELNRVVKKIANSMLDNFNGEELENFEMMKALYLIGDAKGYETQTLRSVQQGGSSLDQLALNMTKKSFLEPPKEMKNLHKGQYNNIVQDIIRGRYKYLSEAVPGSQRDPATNTVRGIRSLLELPFMHVSNEEVLLNELKKLTDLISRGKVLSKKARLQIDKLARNAIHGGAHNRFYRARPGTVSHAALQLAKAIGKQEGRSGSAAIPKYLDEKFIETRTVGKEELNGFPRELLMSRREFIKRHTDDGRLYHGTPRKQNGIGILRGGLFISDENHGTARYGSGTYTSKQRSFAAGYASKDGLIFNLEVKNNNNINIIDMSDPKVYGHSFIKRARAQAGSEGIHLFEFLKRDHNIDIIVNTHVIVQNKEVFEFPRNFRAIMETYLEEAYNPNIPLEQRFKSLEIYSNLFKYAKAMGEQITSPPSLFVFLKDIFEKSSSTNQQKNKILEIILKSDLIEKHKNYITKMFKKALRADSQDFDTSITLMLKESRLVDKLEAEIVIKLKSLLKGKPKNRLSLFLNILHHLMLKNVNLEKYKDEIVQYILENIKDFHPKSLTFLLEKIMTLENDLTRTLFPKVITNLKEMQNKSALIALSELIFRKKT